MKKLLIAAISALGLIAAACSESQPEYVVKGSTSQERLNGQRVFIVPYGSPTIEDSVGVDSTVIEDGKFEFRLRKGTYLARVTVDRHVRPGTQDLLIVTEPGGDIIVLIDSVSSGHGTPQNEALQTWKELKEDHDRVQWTQSQRIKYLREQGDTVYAAALTDSLRQYNEHYRKRVRDIMRMMGPGPAYDFLLPFYGDPSSN